MKLNMKFTDFVCGYRSVTGGRMTTRLKRRIKMIVLLLVTIVIGLTVGGCGNDEEYPVPNYTTVPHYTTVPSREDIIQAVRRSVEGNTYTVTSSRQERIIRTCSQIDVDFDPYMPGNPELAKCPRVGATYKEWETVYDSETRTCESLPNVDAGWYVEEIGDNKWRVSLSGSVWDVEKLDGASASVGDYVEVSGFTFKISSDQGC